MINKRYRLVVFDWEGTLSDTLGLILNCVAMVAKQLHYGELDEDLARQSVELGLVKAIKRVFPQLTLHQHEQLLTTVQKELMVRHNEVYLIPGAKAMVQQLYEAGIDLAIATNKGQNSLQRALHSTGLDVFFKVTRSAGQTPPKPCPQMLEEILAVFDVPVDQALMIGDSSTDMQMAKSIGMDAIGVNFYHQHPDEMLLSAGALKVVDDFHRLAHDFQ